MAQEKFAAALPSVLVVILNWNGWKDSLTSVDSVLRLDYPNLSVLLIDNGSTDGSVAHLRNLQDGRVELLELPENLGFTGGCNVGFNRALAEGTQYVWLFNSDAVAANKSILGSLVALAESDIKIGLVAPRCAEQDEGGRLTFAGGVYSLNPFFCDTTEDPEIARRWAMEYPDAGLVTGTGVLVKTALIREIGLLDDMFFAYFEFSDYSYRCTRAGYKVLADENSIIWHPHKSIQVKPLAIKPHWWYYKARNECLLWKKHLGIIRAFRPSWWTSRRMMVYLFRCREDQNITNAILAGLWHGWTGRGGAYRPEYRMPRPLAAVIRKFASRYRQEN